ncbi:hypothetical protein GWI33_006437 [Rhynchophorus ferrugineus]|uniref:Uncharacterized protein n=1 Tax=Rhynchophorus ferrugineus TaxID=354439 RepID=A0A834IHM8_RHYFE|nr:hypothetical protein GWI33_006437 [Rhynchophorus ferrugineus]
MPRKFLHLRCTSAAPIGTTPRASDAIRSVDRPTNRRAASASRDPQNGRPSTVACLFSAAASRFRAGGPSCQSIDNARYSHNPLRYIVFPHTAREKRGDTDDFSCVCVRSVYFFRVRVLFPGTQFRM